MSDKAYVHELSNLFEGFLAAARDFEDACTKHGLYVGAGVRHGEKRVWTEEEILAELARA